jgi:biopolymer transport protein ExbB
LLLLTTMKSDYRTSLLMLALLAAFLPSPAFSWFNDSWTSRKQVALDAGVTGADIKETLTEFPLLVRLSTANFGFFNELGENGKDLRFMVDDKTAIKHAVEKIDPINQMGFVWIKLPTVRGGVSTDSVWMYYANASATDGSDTKGIYDTAQALVMHFSEGQTLPQDATAYGNHASESQAVIDPAGWIGAAAKLNGNGHIDVKASPSLEINPDNGWTASAWVKIDAAQTSSLVFLAQDGPNMLDLSINGTAAVAHYVGPHNEDVRTAPAALQVGKWQHLAIVAQKDKLEVYVDGAPAGNTAINLVPMTPALFIGGADSRQNNLIGMLDEVQIASKARSPDWIKLLFRSQSPDFNVLSFGEDEGKGSSDGPNYFTIILQSLTVDGWVVIGLCGVMFVISSLVIITKGLSLARAKKDNKAFLEQYRNLGASDAGALDHEETEEEKDIGDSEFLAAVAGKHDHFQSSPIYHVYHAGAQELKKRYGDRLNQPLSEQALDVLRARLDAAVVREGQKLNKNMVLLTIAISGGPFLGLLGTVLGVMITFAVIAATGDVNINSIAPGISGALLATVAGLAVAIPALFAYNYLLTQIKDVTADMKVFTDEFLALIAEQAFENANGGGK